MTKRSRLWSEFFFPLFGRSGYRKVGTGQNRPFESRTSPAFGGLLYSIYSKHPNTKPRAVFELHLMPVPIIRISDHLKSGQKNPDASLDRYGMKKNIFYDLFL
jgi:hypothetical protein